VKKEENKKKERVRRCAKWEHSRDPVVLATKPCLVLRWKGKE
jgi:hypothetical protein